MTAYAIAELRDVTQGADIVEYLERIDATLEPYGGRFIIHGGTPEVVEGTWTHTLVVVEFPTSTVRGPGIGRPPTRRSFRCARGTPAVTPCSSRGWARATGRRTC